MHRCNISSVPLDRALQGHWLGAAGGTAKGTARVRYLELRVLKLQADLLGAAVADLQRNEYSNARRRNRVNGRRSAATA
jgi:hypothetical protein